MRRVKANRRRTAAGSAGGEESLPWSESVAYQLRDTYKAFAQVLKEELDRHDINLGGWPYLRVLWREDGLTQTEVTRRSGLMQPNANAALSQLAKRGLIIQKTDPADRRRINIYLTPQGRALGYALVPFARRIRERALKGVRPGELLLFFDLLAKMRRNLRSDLVETAPKTGRSGRKSRGPPARSKTTGVSSRYAPRRMARKSLSGSDHS